MVIGNPFMFLHFEERGAGADWWVSSLDLGAECVEKSALDSQVTSADGLRFT